MTDVLKSSKYRRFPLLRSPEMQPRVDTSAIEAYLDDHGFGNGKDLAYFAITHSVRRHLPYGRWICKDGREILFNREYQPILQRQDGVCSHCDRTEWVDNDTIDHGEYFYEDANTPVDYLTKHLGRGTLTAAEARACKRSLLICLQMLREYMPAESATANYALKFYA